MQNEQLHRNLPNILNESTKTLSDVIAIFRPHNAVIKDKPFLANF